MPRDALECNVFPISIELSGRFCVRTVDDGPLSCVNYTRENCHIPWSVTKRFCGFALKWECDAAHMKIHLDCFFLSSNLLSAWWRIFSHSIWLFREATLHVSILRGGKCLTSKSNDSRYQQNNNCARLIECKVFDDGKKLRCSDVDIFWCQHWEIKWGRTQFTCAHSSELSDIFGSHFVFYFLEIKLVFVALWLLVDLIWIFDFWNFIKTMMNDDNLVRSPIEREFQLNKF